MKVLLTPLAFLALVCGADAAKPNVLLIIADDLRDTFPDRPIGVPAWIKASPCCRDITEMSEGKPTGFPDWTNAEWRRYDLDFTSEFAKRYDTDLRT